MSTTLIPPGYYVVKPRGQSGRVFPTIAQAGTALVMLGPTPAAVSAINGSRTRSLTETELRELRQRVRAHRLHARKAQANPLGDLGSGQRPDELPEHGGLRRDSGDKVSAVID